MDNQQVVDGVMDAYRSLSAENVDQMRSIYSIDVCFEDPAHRIEGIEDLLEYFNSMYKNVDSCSFEFHDHMLSESSVMMRWTMTIGHPKLNGGDPVNVDGCSYLRTEDGRVSYHRDYFDLGSMIYEQLPVLGPLVRSIKRRLGQ